MSQKKAKANSILSPENYIRQRARSLPLYECMVNSDWEVTKIVNVIVSRRHTTGNFTVGLYLADLFCQGIKDTHFYFNLSKDEYSSFRKRVTTNQPIEIVSYVLAHNIIFAAHEFAGECGLDSHPDFTGITQYILEEDSDNIELVDIECGEEGTPVFIATPGQSLLQVQRKLARLDKNIGPGNYKVVYHTDDYPYDSDNEITDDDNEDL